MGNTPEQKVVRTPEQLKQAVVDAFVNGDAATSQHIVDELGARAQGER